LIVISEDQQRLFYQLKGIPHVIVALNEEETKIKKAAVVVLYFLSINFGTFIILP
jgi:hypothetical protein